MDVLQITSPQHSAKINVLLSFWNFDCSCRIGRIAKRISKFNSLIINVLLYLINETNFGQNHIYNPAFVNVLC